MSPPGRLMSSAVSESAHMAIARRHDVPTSVSLWRVDAAVPERASTWVDPPCAPQNKEGPLVTLVGAPSDAAPAWHCRYHNRSGNGGAAWR